MPSCPFCKANLSVADVESRQCPKCSQMLPSDITADVHAAPNGANAEQGPPGPPPGEKPNGESDTADENHLEETLRTGVPPEKPAAEEQAKNGDTADEKRIAETLNAGTPSEPPAGEEPDKNSDTADEKRIAETLGTGVPSGPPAGEEPGDASDTADEKRIAKTLESGPQAGIPAKKGEITVDDRRFAQTLKSGELTPQAAERISMIWSQTVRPEMTPRTSIKAEIQSVESESGLLIQPRVVREAKQKLAGRADYELVGQLGEGGMGVVYAARQASIDRTVAVKMLKAAGAADVESRDKFLSEAVVTGDLEHPNIVPIYDLARTETGDLFYSMKEVKGTPWDVVIRERTFQENIEILMKVADAVAFAHSRGVVHRDLKPENVMLGDFGEVLLMDWGLALSLGSAAASAGMGGTPAYMAPEMASGPVELIGLASDIYLLGAILYEIATGTPPHTGKNVMECLFAAAKNEIQPTEKSGELVAIALEAMATEPQDRHANVGEFQQAIREYQSHSESISLSTRAEEDLQEARETDNYETFSRALFGFQEAVNLWEGNTRAQDGISETSAAYATSALGKGDYDLGASLLDVDNPAHAEALEKIKEAQRERDARQHRLKIAKRVGVGLVLTIFVIITVAFVLIRRQMVIANEQRAEAVRQKNEADTQRTEAIKQKNEADTQRAEAVKQQKLAVAAQRQEEYGAYIARIGLAAAKIEENAFDKAIELLNQCPAHLRDWEWGRLMHLCTQDIQAFEGQQPLDAVAFSPDGGRFVTGGWGGTARIWDAASGEELVVIATGGQYIFAVAFSPDGKHVATGTNDRPNYVKIWDVETGNLVQQLRGHGDAVLSVTYSRDGKRLLTSSYDNTARLWDLQGGQSQVFEGHDWWVWRAAFSPDEKRIVTASQDGSAIVWSVETGKADPPFLGHVGPVYAAAFSPDGEHVATAGYDKRVLLWKPDEVRPFDYETLLTEQEKPPPVFEVFEGHTASVRSVQFSVDGKLLVTGADDNTVRVWDVASRRPLRTLRGHAGQVHSCVFSPDGGRILSASHDHQAKIWSIAGYEEIRVLRGRLLEGHRDAILGAGFSPDGGRIVSASRDRTAKTWDSQTGEEVHEFKEGHDFLASTAVFFADEKRLLTAAVDNTTRMWDVATGTELLTLQGTGPSAAVALSLDGEWIFTGSDDKTAKLWDAESGKLLKRLEGHRSEVTAVAISPDSRLLFTGDASGRCRLWNAETGETLWQSEGHSRGITAAFFLPTGKRVLTASTDNTVGQWDVETGREELSLVLKHPDAVTSMALSPDGRQALTTCTDKTVRLWDVETGQLIRPVVAGDEMINAVAFSPDGRRALCASSENTVRLWDLETGQEIPAAGGRTGAFIDLSAGGGMVWSAVFSPSGGYILTVGGTDALLWELESGEELMRFSPHGSVASASFSPDGRHIVTGSWDNTARIWNVETGAAERKLIRGHTQFVNTAVYSPDGMKVLTASDDKTAMLWDAKTGKPLQTFVGHDDRVRSAVFSSDGTRVLTASNDKTARIWDAETGELLHVLQGHEQAVLSAAFSADGTRVITASEDNTAKVWDAETGQELPFSLEGHTASVTSVAFSPNGMRAVTGSQDNTAKVWDSTTGNEILTLKGHLQEVTCVNFSPDGQSVLTGSRDGTLILWLAVDWQTTEPGEETRIAALATPSSLP